MDELQRELPDVEATQALACQLASFVAAGGVVWLRGELGAGKTTFARSVLRALGVAERIKSPTYSLVEHYPLASGNDAWHLDLYRIAGADEMDYLGLDALWAPGAVSLVEWPERGGSAIPPADLEIHLSQALEAAGRHARIVPVSARAHAWLRQLAVMDPAGESSTGACADAVPRA